MGDSFLIFGFQECPDNCPPVRVWFRVRDKMGWGRGAILRQNYPKPHFCLEFINYFVFTQC